MKMAKLVLFLLLLMAVTACGTMVTVKSPPQRGLITKEAKKVLIFPLPVYEEIDPAVWLELNLQIFEEVADSFQSQGYNPLPYETVLSFLAEKGFLSVEEQTNTVHPSVLMTLEEADWSTAMREEIIKAMGPQTPKVHLNLEQLTYLSEKELLDSARAQGVDLLVCGRVSRFRVRPEETLNPFRIGFLTFLTRAPSRLLYGAPQDDQAGRWQEMSVGALWGGLIGAQAKDPFEPPVYKARAQGHPLLAPSFKKVAGDAHYETWNTVVWGLLGASMAYLTSQGGDAPEALLTLSLSVYDVPSGRKIWMSRTELKAVPETVFAPHSREVLLEQTIKQGVDLLMKRFWTDLYAPKLAMSKEVDNNKDTK